MDYAERLEKVAVLGAAGKMGSGIVLLLALEMAELALDPANRSRHYTLFAVDLSAQALDGLLSYVRDQARKAGEKHVAKLQSIYSGRAEFTGDADLIERYVNDVLALVTPVTSIEDAAGANVVFEAAPEDLDLKLRLFARLLAATGGASGADANASAPWIFTNTSSIPIAEIERKAALPGRVMGVHFYNPPAVQRLVELIRSETTQDDVAAFADTLCSRLRKVVVPSADVAGFIGNGHFMRDILHGLAEVERLRADAGRSFVEAVYAVNRVSQDFLVRPMGIFQLVDYVGLDVCQCIMRVMDARLPGEHLHSPLIDRLLEHGIRGGQRHDGSQRDGLLRYEAGKIAAIYDPDVRDYAPLASLNTHVDDWLGPLPQPPIGWKAAVRDPRKDELLAAFFGAMQTMGTPGAALARRYGARSRDIGAKLVADGVARSADDVNQVLLTGFFHAYGPINEYFQPSR